MTKERLLVFDILRIFAILLVILFHMALHVRSWPLDYSSMLGPFTVNLGNFGVIMAIFVSGAVIEANHENLKQLKEAIVFYIKRFIRLYPAWWAAFILAVVVNIGVLSSQFNALFSSQGLFSQFMGLYVYANLWTPNSGFLGGPLDSMGWFIGVLMALYLLYPLISSSIRSRPWATIIGLLFIELATIALFTYSGIGYRTAYWFPLCRVFEFGLGIFIVHKGLYPKATYQSKSLRYVSELSFYVFLIHYPLLFILDTSVLLYVFATLLLSAVLFAIDRALQRTANSRIDRYIRKNNLDKRPGSTIRDA